MFKKYYLLGVIAAVALFACGKKNDETTVDKLETVGLYRATSEKFRQANVPWFMVRADMGVYTFVKNQTELKVTYRGLLLDWRFEFSNNHFKSADFEGDKMSGNEAELPENLKLVAELNKSGVALLKELNKDNLKLEFYFAQNNPSFSPLQLQVVNLLLEQKSVLVTYLKSKSLTTFQINDYVRTKLYVQSPTLGLPAKIDAARTAQQIVDDLKNDQNIDTN